MNVKQSQTEDSVGSDFGKMIPFTFMSSGDECHGRYRMVSREDPVLLIATGGSKRGSLGDSWRSFPFLLEAASISCVIFDFSGQGLSRGDRRHLTLSKGVQNLRDVIGVISNWDWIRPEKLALMGSSYGGNVVLDYLASASALPVRGATLKSPCIDLRESYLQELGPSGMEDWEKAGYSDKAGLMWNVIEDSVESDLSARLPKIKTPLLITHGTADESVPISQSRTVRDSVAGVMDLVEMKGTNHHYSDRDDWKRMAAIHIAWLRRLFEN